MKLLSVSIEDYRSIKKITNLDLNSPLTVLVGANEHGKSNILKAINTIVGTAPIPIDDCRKDKNSEVYPATIIFKILFSKKDVASITAEVKAAYPELPKPPIPTEVTFYKYLKPETDGGELKGYYRLEYNGHTAQVADKVYEYIGKTAESKLIYFDEFEDRITSKITLEQIQDNSNSVVSGLLKIAGLSSIRSNIFADTAKNRQLFSVASQIATEQVRLAWRQGNEDDISIHIDKDSANQVLNIDVHDKNNYVDVASRSRGFLWFLSFYLSYRAQQDGDIDSSESIFVMDEPGLFLHPKGQKDLLQIMEKLGENNQVIYTTHSPFMVNRLEPNAVKVVVKKEKEGTLVNVKGFSSNWKPLRTSLGMVLADSFYFADKTLVVEGVEDQIYITALLKFFYRENVIPKIDVNLLSIIAAGGLQKFRL